MPAERLVHAVAVAEELQEGSGMRTHPLEQKLCTDLAFCVGNQRRITIEAAKALLQVFEWNANAGGPKRFRRPGLVPGFQVARESLIQPRRDGRSSRMPHDRVDVPRE